ncbi:MAG: Kae1-associated serine/threonine protein kinase [Nanoarchaeota archaeon]|nr:Kae1-associated serine/threonine protein kinase [Nanoarchaeota archaeon]
MSKEIIGRGAEAIISKSNNTILKHRIKKSYRHPQLDTQLRKRRTKSEYKILEKASKIINVPNLISTNNTSEIKMEFIDGQKLSTNLNDYPTEKEIKLSQNNSNTIKREGGRVLHSVAKKLTQEKIAQIIGQDIAKLHDSDIIHGDLTTSNMILVNNPIDTKSTKSHNLSLKPSSLNKKSNTIKREGGRVLYGVTENFKIFLIDFGLGYISNKLEDKAVDIHLLKQALEAKHFQNYEALLKSFLKGYKNSENSKQVLERLEAVEKRGRYKRSTKNQK